MSDETALVQVAERENVPTVKETMDSLWSSLEKTAAQNIQASSKAQNVPLEGFSAVEIRSLLYTEMLSLSKGLGFAELMVQGRILQTMERESLHSVHPGGYTTLEELAQDQGISISDLSQIRDLTGTIFPWVKDKLKREPESLWTDIGKSKLRELVPILKRTISGEVARGTVESSYQAVANDVVATFRSSHPDRPVPEGDALKKLVVSQLLESGASMTNANLRQTIRPDRTPSLEPVIIRRFTNGHADSKLFVVLEVTDDQMTMLERRLHGHWDPVRTSASSERDVKSIRLIRQMLSG
jgi:hypothetical protein